MTRGTGLGVEFTCDSDYPCTVTVTNSLGTILASMTTQKLPDAADPMVTAGLPDPVDTFAQLNDGSTSAIRAMLNPTIGDNARTTPDWELTELIGMGIGGPGVTPEQAMLGLRSDFQANGADLAGHAADADNDATTPGTAVPGAMPDLRMGTTISGAMRPDGDGIALSPDMAEAVKPLTDAGWAVKTLHRDWGDTAGDGDGGFETGAIIVNNLGEGTEHPFDRKLADRYVNAAAHDMFDLTLRADGTQPGVTTLATSVDINSAADATNTATATQWANMVFDEGSLVSAQSQDPNIDANETFGGEYFGASGQFQCIEAAEGSSCGIVRDADGVIMVIDTNAATEGIQGGGRWTFTPDPRCHDRGSGSGLGGLRRLGDHA